MKAKSILFLVGLHSIVLSTIGRADSYSVTLQPNVQSVVANQLDDQDLITLGVALPNGTVVQEWNGAGLVAYQKVAGVWNGNPTIHRGEAVYMKIRPISPPTLVNFSGTATAAVPVGINPSGYYLLGSQTHSVTAGATYSYEDITGESPLDGIALFESRLTPPAASSVPYLDPLSWNMYVYHTASGWVPSVPTIVEGQGVWIGPQLTMIEGTVRDNSGSPLPNWPISLSDGRSTLTDANGNYAFAVQVGSPYTITQLPPSCWTSLTAPLTVTVNNQGDVSSGNDFTDMLNVNSPDLSVQVNYVAAPGSHLYPCPGESGYYFVYYHNTCAPVAPGSTLTVTLPSEVSYDNIGNPYVATIPAGGSAPTPGIGGGAFQIGQTLYWTLGPLAASDLGQIRIPVTVALTVTPTTLLTASAQIDPPTGVTDINTANNVYVHSILSKCSNDPNDKTVVPAGCGPTGLINGNQPLTYTVQFQNLGAAPAFDVVVHDLLDPSLDASSIEIIGASHSFVYALNGRDMVWTFPSVFLPAAVDDEPASHGFFSYRVWPMAGVADGTTITNQAAVFFDLNAPVMTAITTNTITSDPQPVASFTVAALPGSAGFTNDFTYTGGTPGATFLWNFGSDAIPSTSTDMNPAGVVFASPGLRNVNLQVSLGGCGAAPATYILSVGPPKLNIVLNGNQVCLSWDGEGYSLQQTGTLNTPTSWLTINPPITLVGSKHVTCLTVTDTSMFYRLTDLP